MAVRRTESIGARLERVTRRIHEAARRAGRDAAEVRLVVITKGHPTETIRAAYACCLRRFGENRIEEALPKIAELRDLPDLEWHLVGPLQSRKVGLVGEGFALLHAVDRLKIARRLDAEASRAGRVQPVLLECNVSGEPTKAGWRLANEAFWDQDVGELLSAAALPHLEVRGLMTMAPLTADVGTQRETFRRLARLRDFLSARLGRDLPELSMGMSDDFEAAIEEGATLVRIGRAILGERM